MSTDRKFKFKTLAGIIPAVIISSLLISSCTSDVEYPIEPEITFKEYEIFSNDNGNDTALFLVFTFTDGDGDIGLAEWDTLTPFNSGSEYYFNLYVDYLEFVDSQFTKVTPNPFSTDTISYEYRLPRDISPTTNNKAIKGEIKLKINDILANNLPIKFRLFIYDRELHKSNVIESPSIYYYP